MKESYFKSGFTRLMAVLFTVLSKGAICGSTLKFIVDKDEDIHKLGPSPVLTFYPETNSSSVDLQNSCSIRQSKLVMYLPIPFYHKLPLPSEGNPSVQVINLDQKSLILYRDEQGKDVKSMLVSTLPNQRPHLLGIQQETANLTDSKLLFKIDLSLPTLPTFRIYFMNDSSHIISLTLNYNTMELVKKEVLTLPHICAKRAFAVENSNIYILEPLTMYKLTHQRLNFSSFTIQETKLQREYSSFAIVNGTFVFVRGYGTLVMSPSWNPEDHSARTYPLTFNHGMLKYAGFNNYVLSLASGETGSREFYYFLANETSPLPHHQRLELIKLKGSSSPMVKGLSRLVQYKEAMYYVYPKKIALEYFGSNTEPVEMIKQTYGAVLGIVGPYNRTVDSVHPLEAYRIGLSNKLRLRKLYTNSLQSELICRRPKGLKSPRVLKATISTRKNNLDVEVVFVEEQTHVIPPPPPKPNKTDPIILPRDLRTSFEKMVLYILLGLAATAILILVCLLRQARRNKKTLMKQIHDIMSGTPSASGTQSEASMELSQDQSTDKPTNTGLPAQETLSADMTL